MKRAKVKWNNLGQATFGEFALVVLRCLDGCHARRPWHWAVRRPVPHLWNSDDGHCRLRATAMRRAEAAARKLARVK